VQKINCVSQKGVAGKKASLQIDFNTVRKENTKKCEETQNIKFRTIERTALL
jgi:hypothetical protein